MYQMVHTLTVNSLKLIDKLFFLAAAEHLDILLVLEITVRVIKGSSLKQTWVLSYAFKSKNDLAIKEKVASSGDTEKTIS